MARQRILPGLAVVAALGAGATGALVASGPDSAGAPVVLVASGTSAAAGQTCNGGGNPGCTGDGNNGGGSVKDFGVSVGTVAGLYPGRTMQLPVTYRNPNSFDIDVSSYTVTASVPAASAAACPASNLSVASGTVTLSPPVNLGRNTSTTRSVPVGLKASAPDGCQDRTFTVSVTAWAVKK